MLGWLPSLWPSAPGLLRVHIFPRNLTDYAIQNHGPEVFTFTIDYWGKEPVTGDMLPLKHCGSIQRAEVLRVTPCRQLNEHILHEFIIDAKVPDDTTIGVTTIDTLLRNYKTLPRKTGKSRVS